MLLSVVGAAIAVTVVAVFAWLQGKTEGELRKFFFFFLRCAVTKCSLKSCEIIRL